MIAQGSSHNCHTKIKNFFGGWVRNEVPYLSVEPAQSDELQRLKYEANQQFWYVNEEIR